VANDRNFGFGTVMLVVTALVIVGVIQALFSLVGSPETPTGGNEAALLERIRPVGRLNTGAPITIERPVAAPAAAATPPPNPASASAASAPSAAKPAKVARSGEQVYDTTCKACHGAGVAGAPRLGDKAAWAPRIQGGMELLVSHAIKGFTGKSGVMPPRGTCGNCTDAELRSAVEYMVTKSR